MTFKSKGIFVISAKRTPFCKYGGSLRDTPASHAFAAAAKDAMQTANIDPSLIDSTIVGNINFLSQCDGGKTPRYCGIYSGVNIDKPALGVNRACASGLQAVITGGMEILTNAAKMCLTGGTEIMSSLPLLVRNIRFGATLGMRYTIEDHIKTQFVDTYTGLTLQKIAEDVAKRRGITRNDVDEFTFNSYLKWKNAQNSNVFEAEITNLETVVNKKHNVIIKDELTHPELNFEDLEASPTINEGSIVTAYNSAAPGDGAAVILLASEEIVKRHNLKPLARVSGWSCVGSNPSEGLGAVEAIIKLKNKLDININDIDIFEINEIFASQTLVMMRELKLDKDKVNISGGSLAIGHHVSATGVRMITHIVHQMRSHKLRTAIAASSCGDGQGVAIMFESI